MKASDLVKFLDPLRKRVMNMVARGVVQIIYDSKGTQRLKTSFFANEIIDNVERFQNYGFTSNPLPGAESLALFHSGNRDHGIIICVDDRRFRLKNLQSGEIALYTDEGDFIHFKRGNKIEIKTKELIIDAETKVNITTVEANITSEKANVTSPEVSIVASTKVDVTTPVMNVSGLVNCAGIGAGAPAEPGKAKVQGSVEASGEVSAGGSISSGGSVSDSVGPMSEIRTKYNSHTHPSNGTPTPSM